MAHQQKLTNSFVAKVLTFGLSLAALSIWSFSPYQFPPRLYGSFDTAPSRLAPSDQCPQFTATTPERHVLIWENLLKGAATEGYQEKAVKWLSGAIQIVTESYDNMGPVGEDPRWEAFGPFHDYLLRDFPLVYSTLSVTKVNTWGLVYVWNGRDRSLKPLLLTGHQDVVPVDPGTVDKWIHPPYSGHFDGERIWGRGTADDKNGLIAILAAVEYLVSAGFKPERTLVLAFGFDEESSGLEGAGALSEYLLATFGRNAFAMVVDEGDGYLETYGSVTALPSVTEKGYIDIRLSVSSPGGHSSVPPKHTSIGLLAKMIAELEENPIPTKLLRDDVYYETLLCVASHSVKVDDALRQAILDSATSDEALELAESIIFKDPETRSLIGTTRAIDIVGGGVKANALPEEAWVVINHRIATESSVSQTIRSAYNLLKPLATSLNLSLTSFGEAITDPTLPTYGSIVLSDPWNTKLESAPISPYRNSPAFRVLSGTIKGTYNAHRGLEGNENIMVYPSYLFGNTDTRFYWELSENIYRYNHEDFDKRDGLGGIHTINENICADSLLGMIKFFVALILNADEAVDL